MKSFICNLHLVIPALICRIEIRLLLFILFPINNVISVEQSYNTNIYFNEYKRFLNKDYAEAEIVFKYINSSPGAQPVSYLAAINNDNNFVCTSNSLFIKRSLRNTNNTTSNITNNIQSQQGAGIWNGKLWQYNFNTLTLYETLTDPLKSLSKDDGNLTPEHRLLNWMMNLGIQFLNYKSLKWDGTNFTALFSSGSPIKGFIVFDINGRILNVCYNILNMERYYRIDYSYTTKLPIDIPSHFKVQTQRGNEIDIMGTFEIIAYNASVKNDKWLTFYNPTNYFANAKMVIHSNKVFYTKGITNLIPFASSEQFKKPSALKRYLIYIGFFILLVPLTFAIIKTYKTS